MMKKILFLFLILAVVSSCKKGDNKTSKKANLALSTGNTSEILVIAPKQVWDSKVGDSIKTFFGQYIQGLPQAEPKFDLVCMDKSALKSQTYYTHRNLLILDVHSKNDKTFIETKENLWSSPQRVIKITAKGDTAFQRIFNENKEVMLSLYDENENKKMLSIFKAFVEGSIGEKIKKRFEFALDIPGGFYVAKEHENFMWIRKEPQDFSLGILLHTYPYTDTIQLENAPILTKRNLLTQNHIPGPVEGTYMITAEELRPESKAVNFKDLYAVETKGLWELEGNYYMGGPFKSYTIIDEKRNRLILIDGYVFAPKKDKRDLMRQIDAILYSFRQNP